MTGCFFRLKAEATPTPDGWLRPFDKLRAAPSIVEGRL